MVSAMCGVQLKDGKSADDLMLMLGWNKTLHQSTTASSVHWCGHVLRREDGHVLRRALDIEVEGQRKKRMLYWTWKKQIEEESMKVGLRRKDALCRSMWSVGVNLIAAGLRWIWPPLLVGDTTGYKKMSLYSLVSHSCCLALQQISVFCELSTHPTILPGHCYENGRQWCHCCCIALTSLMMVSMPLYDGGLM